VQGRGRGKEGNPPLVNYIKAGTDMRPHRYHDPRELQRSFSVMIGFALLIKQIGMSQPSYPRNASRWI
jgi:hypothetical protein